MSLESQLLALIVATSPGVKLPTERELAERFGVSRAHIRQQLNELETKGAIVRKRRIGTVVTTVAAELLKAPVYVGRKSLAEMDNDQERMRRNRVSSDFEDNLASRASDYRLVRMPYTNNPDEIRRGGRPTIFCTGGVYLPEFVAHGLCEDLTGRLSAWPEASGIWPNLFDSARHEGKLLGLPVSAHLFFLFCNRVRMEECGLDPDVPPRNWDELLSAAEKMTDPASGRYGLAIPTDYHLPWFFTGMYAQTGGRVIKGSFFDWEPSFHEPAGLAALKFLHDLRWKHQVLYAAPGNCHSTAEALLDGRVGMYFMESAEMMNFLASRGVDDRTVSMSHLPSGPDGHSGCLVSTLLMVLNTCAPDEEKEAGWRHLQNLYGRENYRLGGRAMWEGRVVRNWPPIHRDLTPADTGVKLPHEWFRILQRALALAEAEPAGVGWNSNIYLDPLLRRILSDPHADPEEELNLTARLVRPGGMIIA